MVKPTSSCGLSPLGCHSDEIIRAAIAPHQRVGMMVKLPCYGLVTRENTRPAAAVGQTHESQHSACGAGPCCCGCACGRERIKERQCAAVVHFCTCGRTYVENLRDSAALRLVQAQTDLKFRNTSAVVHFFESLDRRLGGAHRSRGKREILCWIRMTRIARKDARK